MCVVCLFYFIFFFCRFFLLFSLHYTLKCLSFFLLYIKIQSIKILIDFEISIYKSFSHSISTKINCAFLCWVLCSAWCCCCWCYFLFYYLFLNLVCVFLTYDHHIIIMITAYIRNFRTEIRETKNPNLK